MPCNCPPVMQRGNFAAPRRVGEIRPRNFKIENWRSIGQLAEYVRRGWKIENWAFPNGRLAGLGQGDLFGPNQTQWITGFKNEYVVAGGVGLVIVLSLLKSR